MDMVQGKAWDVAISLHENLLSVSRACTCFLSNGLFKG